MFLALTLPAFSVFSSYDNFFEGPILDAYKARQKWLIGVIGNAICLIYMVVKIYEFPGPSRVQTLKSWIPVPIFPSIYRIYRDTAIVVIISYFLLLDINSNFIWLCIFPILAIGFIYALFRELCYSVGQNGPSVEPNTSGETTKEPEELEFIVMAPFFALFGLCIMAYIDDRAGDRFAVSQFLLFLSSTLGVLTRMMIRLPASPFPDIHVTSASELLQKTFLLLLLVTVHTMVAEALGQDVVLACMPEVVPVFLWFSVHLDRDSSIITIDKIKPYTNGIYALIVLAIASLPYLVSSTDESRLSSCASIMVACGVSGALTYYVVFMLHQWPGQQSAFSNSVAANISPQDTRLQSEKQIGMDKGATASSEVAVQSEGQVGSSADAVQLLMLWANVLLMVAVTLLLIKYCSQAWTARRQETKWLIQSVVI